MEEIATLKTKYIKNTDAHLKELLKKQINFRDHIKNKQELQFNEDEKKIEELTSIVNSLKEELQTANVALERQQHTLTEHIDHLKELETEKKKLVEENQRLESKKGKMKSSKPNLQDEELLENGRLKYELYKSLTRIRWDYENLKECTSGYVTNKRDYIHHFCYKDLNDKELSDLLWQEIYKSVNRGEDTSINDKKNGCDN